MNTFTIIFSKFLKNIDIVDNEIKHSTNYNGCYLLQQYDNIELSNNMLTHYVHHKYDVLNKYILNSFFFVDELKEYYFDVFCKSQKVYNILCRTIRKFKIRNSIRFDNNTDLCLNDISDFSEGSIIHMYIDITRTTYTFRISDIIQIINNALTYSPAFFAEPYYIKNPYTNVNFTYSELLSIYFTIKNSNFIMPHFFHQFFLNNFNITNYTHRNETLIREEAIKSFVNNSTMLEKYKYIVKMLIEFDKYYSITNVDTEFPKKKLVDVFSFLLTDYLTYEFSLISTLRSFSKTNVKYELIKFKKHNPTFGRKIIIKKYNYDDNKNSVFEFGKRNSNFTRVYKFIDTINNKKTHNVVNRRKNKSPYKITYKRTFAKFKRQQYTYNLDKLFTWKMENVSYKPTLIYMLITKINNNFSKNIKNTIAQFLNASSFTVVILNKNNCVNKNKNIQKKILPDYTNEIYSESHKPLESNNTNK